jgi:hypothetical protein
MNNVIVCKYPYKVYPYEENEHTASSIKKRILEEQMKLSKGVRSLQHKTSTRINEFSGSIQSAILSDITGGQTKGSLGYVEKKFEEFGGWDNKNAVDLYGRLLAFWSIICKNRKFLRGGYTRYGFDFMVNEISGIFNKRAIKKIYAICDGIVSKQNGKKQNDKDKKSRLSIVLYLDGCDINVTPFDNDIDMNQKTTKNHILDHFNEITLALRRRIKFVKIQDFEDIDNNEKIWKSESFSKLKCVTKNGIKYWRTIKLTGIKCKLPSLAKGISDDTADEYVKKLISVKMKKESKCLLLKMLIPILYMSKRRRNKIREDKILDFILKSKNMRRLGNS